jgi:hypothetical protein
VAYISFLKVSAAIDMIIAACCFEQVPLFFIKGKTNDKQLFAQDSVIT